MSAEPTLARPDQLRPIAEMGHRTKVIVMAGTMLGLFTSAMDQTVVGTSMPTIIADLGGFGLFSWVGTGFMLASVAAIAVVGKLTDIYGRKPFYMAGIFMLLLGSALCGSSQNVEQLIAFRVIQGLGAGMIMGIAFAILGDVFTPAERGALGRVDVGCVRVRQRARPSDRWDAHRPCTLALGLLCQPAARRDSAHCPPCGHAEHPAAYSVAARLPRRRPASRHGGTDAPRLLVGGQPLRLDVAAR